MKKLYIYLLLSFVCFFGFSMGVGAQIICEYKLNEMTVAEEENNDGFSGKSGKIDESSDYYFNVDVIYDSLRESGKQYYVTINGTPIKNGKLKENFGGKEFEDNLSKEDAARFENGKCPDNVWVKHQTITKKGINVANYLYSFSNTSGALTSYTKVPNTNKYSGKKDGKNSSVLKDKQTCEFTLPYCDKDGKEGICYYKVVYNDANRSLDIHYGTNKDKLFVLNSNLTTYTCGSMNDLRNFGLGMGSTNVLISNRQQFNEKFIEYWEKSPDSCETIYNTSKKCNTISSNSSILPDAKELCENGGCDNYESKDFVNLEDWNYDWAGWYNKENEYNNCESLIGDKITATINDILLYVRILIPLLLIGLGVADFVKAMISPDETAMKKAQNKFLKRLIIAAVIFLIPSLVNLLFDLVNGVWAHINNSACNIWN